MKKKHHRHLHELEAENEYLKRKMHIYEKLLNIKYNLKGQEIRSFVDFIEEVWYRACGEIVQFSVNKFQVPKTKTKNQEP